MAHSSIDQETIDIFCKWSKQAIVQCFSANGFAVDLARNAQLDASLTGCLNGMIKDILVFYEESLLERVDENK